MVTYYMDNRSNLELIHAQNPDFTEGMYLLDKKPIRQRCLVIHNNCSEPMVLHWGQVIQISALSAFDGSVVDYRGANG